MRKKLILNTISVLTICASFVLSSCGCKANENKPPKGDDNNVEEVDKHTHTPSSDWSKDEEAHWHTCSGCDEKLDYEKHIFSDWKIVKEATCLEEGKKERTCSVCGYVQSEVIAKKDHVLDTTWSNDETSHWHTCSGCDQKFDNEAHTFGDWKIVKEATCLEEGKKERTCSVCGYVQSEVIAKKDHQLDTTWSNDETSHWHTCSGCDQKFDNEAHTFDDWKIVKEATCLEEGKKERTCSVCGYVQSEVIAKKDHQLDTTWSNDETSHWHTCSECGEKFDVANHEFSEPVIVKEATCYEDGLKTETCKICGYKKETIIPKLEHTISKTWSYNNLYHWHTCSVCDEHIGQEVHTFKVINTVPATCSKEGFILKQCECGYTVKVVLPKTPHENISNIKVVKPTISEDGSLSGKCECGETITLRYPSIKEMLNNQLIDPLAVNTDKKGRVMLTGKEVQTIIKYVLADAKNDSLTLKSVIPFVKAINGDSIDYIFPNSTITIKEGSSLNSGAILIIDCGLDFGVHELEQLPALDSANPGTFRTEVSGSKTRYYLTDATIDNLLSEKNIFSNNNYIKNLLKNFSLGSIIKN